MGQCYKCDSELIGKYCVNPSCNEYSMDQLIEHYKNRISLLERKLKKCIKTKKS